MSCLVAHQSRPVIAVRVNWFSIERPVSWNTSLLSHQPVPPVKQCSPSAAESSNMKQWVRRRRPKRLKRGRWSSESERRGRRGRGKPKNVWTSSMRKDQLKEPPSPHPHHTKAEPSFSSKNYSMKTTAKVQTLSSRGSERIPFYLRK